jgi:hypothetical protein
LSVTSTGSTAASPLIIQAAVLVPKADAPDPAVPDTDPLLAGIVRSICNAVFERDQGTGKTSIGCTSHAPFQRPDEQSTGKIAPYNGEPTEFCRVQQLYKGDFTSATAEQAVLAFDTCSEGEGWNSSAPGSAVLVERGAAGWRVVQVHESINADTCLRATTPGQLHYLVCRSGYAIAQASMTYVHTLDFTQPAPFATSLVKLFENVSGACDALDFDKPGERLNQLAISSFNIRKSADGADTLEVEVEAASLTLNPSQREKAKKTCALSKSGAPSKFDALRSLLPKSTKTILRFQGYPLRAVRDAQQHLSRWHADAPAAMGIGDVAPPL